MGTSSNMKPYVVREGEYLASIAYQEGFSPDEVWSHPRNQALAGVRDPNVLDPGDILFVPDVPQEPVAVSVGATNTYSADVPKVHVHLVMSDGGAPLASQPCVVLGLGEPRELQTEPDGSLSLEVPVNVSVLHVLFPEQEIDHVVRVGYLDPVSTASGQRARLDNLGYGASLGAGFEPWTTQDRRDLEELLRTRAIVAFQKAHGLAPNGETDAATLDALKKAHGS